MRHVLNPFAPLHLTHLTFRGAFENGVWSSTLLEGERVIARVRSLGPDEALKIEPHDLGAVLRWRDRLADPHLFADTLPVADEPMERLADLIDRLAQLRYLDRRVTVLSHRTLVYQLRSDAPHEFHYLPAGKPPVEQLGWLRLAVGQRLLRAIHKGQECPIRSGGAAANQDALRMH